MPELYNLRPSYITNQEKALSGETSASNSSVSHDREWLSLSV